MQGKLTRSNRRFGLMIAVIVAAMLGLAYASVPLYQLFCQVTGFGGTTQRSSEAAPGASETATIRRMRFNSHVSPGLDWKFSPPSGVFEIRPGEQIEVAYTASNLGDLPSTGTASFNVTPNKIGPYFMKMECFCFTEQTLQPGETVTMPVIFYLDPEIDTDINTAETAEVTLSYTFFRVDEANS